MPLSVSCPAQIETLNARLLANCNFFYAGLFLSKPIAFLQDILYNWNSAKIKSAPKNQEMENIA